MPRSVLCQRTSASTPVMRPLSGEMIGWKYSTNSSWSKARCRSALNCRRSSTALCMPRLEHLVATLAVALRRVHGDVGVAQQLLVSESLHGVVVPSTKAMPRLAPMTTSRPSSDEGLVERRPDPLGDLDRRRPVPMPAEQDGELVAAHPGRSCRRRGRTG